ncbi:MAG: asparagine synthase (glutamine-hydrolyzing) [Bacteroidota bacterium]|jgi:asparagine synthase (glutamine-hydrolysing)
MCGFTGYIDKKGIYGVEILRKMTDALVHRGPDDAGYEVLSMENGVAAFGFRRLSILDLSEAGHQPMFNHDRSIAIMLNGEVYNFQELKADLISSGISFKSSSDTEVVLKGYELKGIEFIHSLVGMFAISILDIPKQQLYLIRDRAGVKPLFYSNYDGNIIWGSELKALRNHPAFKHTTDVNALGLYFQNGNIPAPYTIYQDCYKLEPGHYIQFDLSNFSSKNIKYWDVNDYYNQPNNSISYEDAKQRTEKLMIDAFKYRMIADVPVGVFLSGGYDSTAVAALLAKSYGQINTFTIGFEEASFNEANYAEAVAKEIGTNHFTEICTIDAAKDIIPELPHIFDEPFGDSSAIPTTLVSRIAKKHVTVALSADAGDELFAGYPRHLKAESYLKKWNNKPGAVKLLSPFLNAINLNKNLTSANRIEKLIEFINAKTNAEAFDSINKTFTAGEARLLLNANFKELNTIFNSGEKFSSKVSPLNQVLAVEYQTYLVDDILQKVDRATMSTSLEGREPFLDHRLIEFVATLPSEYKLQNGVGKRILKDIVHQYVPKSLMERPKMGFGVPVKKWMKDDLKPLLMEVMGDDALKGNHLLNATAIHRLREDYLAGKVHDFERLWFVFTYLQWFKKWGN